jgi:hypothetical protein
MKVSILKLQEAWADVNTNVLMLYCNIAYEPKGTGMKTKRI